MNPQTLSTLETFVLPILTAVTGWLAGTRKRRNDFIRDLQSSINLLADENRKLLSDITAVNSEVVRLRRENEELKLSIDRLCSENAQLKDEIRGLRMQLSQKNAPTQS